MPLGIVREGRMMWRERSELKRKSVPRLMMLVSGVFLLCFLLVFLALSAYDTTKSGKKQWKEGGEHISLSGNGSAEPSRRILTA